MSNVNKPTNPKEETNQTNSVHRKTSSPATRTVDQIAPQKCPRCDSPNTKFCYYNNYSLTQPRHFCKTCRRYWTKGGALRNVPVGGGCRKNKKLRSSNSNCKDSIISSSSINNIANNNSSSSLDHHFLSSSGFMNLKLFHGISPAMDFNHNNNNNNINHTSLFDYRQNPNTNNNSSSNNNNNSLLSLASGSSNNNNPSNLASSIESLSSINQDLHWKLQQQRLSMLFGGHGHNAYFGSNNNNFTAKANNKPAVPILFQNLEISNKPGEHDQVGIGLSDQTANNNMDQWFFGSDQVIQLAHQGMNNAVHHHHQNQTTNNNNNGNENVTSGNWMSNVNWTTSNTTTNAELHQFSASLP